MQQARGNLAARVVSVFASLCLALALVPAAALADNATAGAIVLEQEAVEVSSGGTVDLTDYVSVSGLSPEDGDCHFDFVAADDATGFTVNKHSGIVSAATVTEDATGVVTVYLMAGEAPSGNSGKPCDGYTELGTATITVNVLAGETVTYGNQGDGIKIQLTSPSVTKATVDGTVYTNAVASQTAGSTVAFTYTQDSGLNQYTNFYSTWGYTSATAAYKALAGQYISYEDASGTATTIADSSTATVTSLSSSSVTISIPVGDTEGTGVLSFAADLHTFNQSDTTTVNKTLGVDIYFVFDIVAADDSSSDDSDSGADGTDTDDGTTDDGVTDDATGDATDDTTTDDTSGTTDGSDATDDSTAGDATEGTGTADGTDSSDTADGGSGTSATTKLVASNVTLAYAKTAYTGKKLTPAVTVKVNGAKLAKGTDYTVSYSNNKAIGRATVKVTGTGSYTGTVNKTFKIVPKKASLKSATKSKAKKKLTVKWAKVAGGVSTYQVRYRVKGTSKWKVKTISGKKVSTTLKKLKSGKKYQVQVRACKTVSGTKYCGAWSKAKTVKVK